MTIKKYNKLVRDKIPEIIYRNGGTPKVTIATPTEYGEFLSQKLKEEVQEYLDEPCVEELADIQEVILSIVEYEGWRRKLEEVRVSKNINRGSFSRRFILLEVKENDNQDGN
jgi:predicted house-cleaning noncanonical NTP pyrophosphatase (MazG superfamily)